ncbi:MAG TPA: DUF1441 family protein, partial [Reyranella sp.]|nr:DUF1441 family protein [Reyranella sp.]
MPRAPSKKTAPEEEHDPVRAGQPSIGDWSATLAGVSIAWLHNAFRMDRQTVKKRLAKLDPIGNGHAGQPVYDFVQAAAYLVKPKVNVAEYIKGLKPTDLPVILQDQYWASQLKRQQWEQRAGKLWHTDDVIEVFGRTFLVIKDTMNLWVENLAEASRGTLTAEQRKVLVGLVDGLQTDIHRNLLEMQAHH